MYNSFLLVFLILLFSFLILQAYNMSKRLTSLMSQVVVLKQRCPHVGTQRHYSLLYVHLLLKKHTDFSNWDHFINTFQFSLMQLLTHSILLNQHPAFFFMCLPLSAPSNL